MATATKYNRDDVIKKATNLFWGKGYHATSMRNLQEAIDLRPGSIYAGFGSKEGLFKESLQYYAHESLALLNSFAENYNSPLEALKAFVASVVTPQEPTSPSNMCMLVKTISELTEDNEDLLIEAQRLLGTLEIAFSKLFSEAQVQGELGATKNPHRLASLLQMQVMGLRAYVRSNKEANIEELIDDVFAAFD